MSLYNEIIRKYEKAWSEQNTEALLDFFADEHTFTDIPLGLYSGNKNELHDLLALTFESIPNFKMEIEEILEGNHFVVTKWKQSGTITAKEQGLNLENFDYQSTVTSIIKFDENFMITSVVDNWDTSMFFQSN